MEKRLSSVSSLMLGHVGPRNTDISHGFSCLVKNVRRSTSAVELDEVIEKELELLRQKLSQPDMGEKKTKEILVRLLYCEMFGHSASFGHITALKMAQQGSLHLKRVGYLAVSLFLHPNHELLLLLVNTVQKDLKSTNILDNCMALTAISNLFGPDMIPAVLHQVIEKMKHTSGMVRKKSVMTIYCFLEKAPHLIHHMTDRFKEALCDREPAVMGAALHIYSKLVTSNPSGHQSLVRPLVSVLMQVSTHKLPVTFEFHGVPAPWMQIRILKMLSQLGHNNEYASNLMYDVLEQMMQKVSLRQMVSYAVHYECISTIAAIYPNKELIALAAKSVSRFLKSRDNNLKYLGIEALGQLLNVDPECGSNHQMIVVECLTDPDLTIRKKTLELLYLMANSSNIEVICEKYLECLPSLTDTVSQQDLSQKVVRMACKHHQSLRWFLKTICELCLLADWEIDNLVLTTIEVIKQNRKSNGGGIDSMVVETFLPYAMGIVSNESLMQLTIWVLGEFCSQEISSLMVQDAFQYLLAIHSYDDMVWQTDTKMFILSALGKIYSKSDDLEMNLERNIETMLGDREPEVRQKAAELIVLTSKKMKKQEIFTEMESSVCDWTLSFLDQFVSDALADGAAPYRPKQLRRVEETMLHNDVKPELFSGLNFQPYSAPPLLSQKSSSNLATNYENDSSTTPTKPGSSVASGGSSEHAKEQQQGSSQLKLSGVKKVWGKSGYIKPDAKKVPKSPSTPEDPVTPSSSLTDTPSQATPGISAATATVQLNTTTALGDEYMHRSGKDVSEEEDPELRQKKHLAQALFGNQPVKKVKQHNQLPAGQKTKNRERNNLVDLLGMNNDMAVADNQHKTPPSVSLDLLKPQLAASSDHNLQPKEMITNSSLQQGKPVNPGPQADETIADHSQKRHQMATDSNLNAEENISTSNLQFDKGITSDHLETDPTIAKSHLPSTESFSETSMKPDQVIPGTLQQQGDLITDSSLNSGTQALPVANLMDDLPSDLHPGAGSLLDQVTKESHRLPSEFQGFEFSKQFDQLCSDETVQMSLCKVWKPKELGLVFFVHNKSASHPVTAVEVTANLPSNLKLTKTEERKFSGRLDSIDKQGQGSLSMCSTCQSPSTNMVIGGDMTYRDHTNTLKRLFFNTTVILADLLRSHNITTEEFGRMWGQPCHDIRLSIDKVTRNLQSNMKHLSKNFPVTVVDIKGNEALCATTILGVSSCLVHFKQEERKLAVWIKTNNKMLRDAISSVITRTLSPES